MHDYRIQMTYDANMIEIMNWCKDNTEDKNILISILSRSIFINNEHDITLFQLRWGDVISSVDIIIKL